MIRNVVLPQLSMGMAEGKILEWAVKDGDFVEKEEALVSVETEKVAIDLPSPFRGFLKCLIAAGETIAVETPIAQIADSIAEFEGNRTSDLAENTPTEVPPIHSLAAQLDVNPSIIVKGRMRASGLAKKVAKAASVDLGTISGTGPSGRILLRDIQNAVKHAGSSTHAGPTPATANLERARIPLTGMRKTIAERMVKSKTTAAHTYAFFEVDISKLLSIRQTFIAREKELKERVSLIAMYAKGLAVACRYVPICNATISDNEIIVWNPVNIGIAVALPGKSEFESGLVVPVVRDVERKGLLELNHEIKDVVDKARDGQLNAGATSGGTITLSSSAGFVPGQWCVSTPLLNQPQVVNFQPGSPMDKPTVVDGQIVIRTVLPCGISFDHRAMDGEPMGRFIRKLAEVLSSPELMLL
jgi:pyruvate dehydrogenase E2 component (dihydrolipoamide acetyltransferase)